MDVNLVLRKTAMGEAEIKTRAHDLVPTLRVLLILSDGKKSIAQLHQNLSKMPSYSGSSTLIKNLTQLIAEGYLEDASGRIQRDSEGHGGDHWNESDVQSAKQELIAMASDVLGTYDKKIVQKIESAADSKEGILSALSDCTKLVRLVIDEDKAKQLATKGRAIIADRG